MTKHEQAARDIRDRFQRAVARHRRRMTAETWFALGTILAEANGTAGELSHELREAEGLGDKLDPIACWKKCVGLAPRHAAAWHRLAEAYFELDDHGRAGPALRRALKLDPHVAAAWNKLAILTLAPAEEIDLARVRRAERYLRRAIAEDPRGRKLGWEPYAWLAEAAERRRDDPGALAWYAASKQRGDRYASARSQVIEGHGARRRASNQPRSRAAHARRSARGRTATT
jgi:tetratricopeptide (TPR) repeat protein